MAIDTAYKRRSSAASRRMPWMRRFGVAPDGAISQADRQSGPWVYAGISGAVIVSGPGCWTSGQIATPGFKAAATVAPGFREGQTYLPGFRAGEREC